MNRDKISVELEETRRLIENHRAWTARAFCMATAELRGSFEPDRGEPPEPLAPTGTAKELPYPALSIGHYSPVIEYLQRMRFAQR